MQVQEPKGPTGEEEERGKVTGLAGTYKGGVRHIRGQQGKCGIRSERAALFPGIYCKR